MLFYIYDINSMTDFDADNWLRDADETQKSDIMRLLNLQKRKSKIAADHLCRKAVSEFCGIAPQDISFSKNEYRKPFADNLQVYFSVSHSGDMVVCAVSDREIGIDIEKVKPYNLRTAERFATPHELEYVSSSQNGFFEIWTLKEAYFKCIGTGLGADIKKVSFEITPQKIICSEKGFDFSFIDAANGYICSVCHKSKNNFSNREI